MAGLGGHRRFCDGLMAANDLYYPDTAELYDDNGDTEGAEGSNGRLMITAGSLERPIVLPGRPVGPYVTCAAAAIAAASSAASELLPSSVAASALACWDLACYVAARVDSPSWAEHALARLQTEAEAAAAAAAAAAAEKAEEKDKMSPPPKKKRCVSRMQQGEKKIVEKSATILNLIAVFIKV